MNFVRSFGIETIDENALCIEYNPPKCYHSASLCRLPLSLKPNEIAMPIKTTPREAIFVTEGRVNLKANGFKEGYSMAKTSFIPI